MPAAALPIQPFWTQAIEAQSNALGCGTDGLSQAEAAERLSHYGRNEDARQRSPNPVRAILRRLLEPL